MRIFFDVSNIYYLPQFLPVINVFLARGHKVEIVCCRCNISKDYESLLLTLSVSLRLPFSWVSDEKDALNYYLEQKPDWVFFANGFKYVDQLASGTQTAQLGHGIGPKPSYYHKSAVPMTVRFMEGALRLAKIRELYPNGSFVQVGYSKLDPIINGSEVGLNFASLGLDAKKQTILYAPTFNPSSLECFPDNWPSMFANYNILIKPHSFSYTIARYAKQRVKLKKWAKYSNVHVAGEDELSIVPYMKNADILLSEASSTLFEFSALGKPVIVCNFFKLKWSYRGIFKYRFIKRFGKDNVLYEGIGKHVTRFKELLATIPQQLASPGEYSENRQAFTHDHVGPMDGQASLRIVKWTESHSNNERFS